MQWILVVKDHGGVVVFQSRGKSIHEARIKGRAMLYPVSA
jgi:hypothetical protein